MAAAPPSAAADRAPCAPEGEETKPLHIISWNVAAWATTLALIRSKHGSLSVFLQRHNCDILCLQEVRASQL